MVVSLRTSKESMPQCYIITISKFFYRMASIFPMWIVKCSNQKNKVTVDVKFFKMKDRPVIGHYQIFLLSGFGFFVWGKILILDKFGCNSRNISQLVVLA